MAKMVDIEKLKPLLNGILTEENEPSFIEGVMGIAVDYDEKAVQGRIDEAVNAAKAEAKADYSKKLHDMFFGGATEDKAEESIDDTKTDPELSNDDIQVEPIFVDEK